MKKNREKKIAIIGAGAGGVFCAIETKRLLPEAKVIIFERSNSLLSKVRISGGGRCNVTHREFDPKKLSQNYPRGNLFLLPLFYRFQPEDMISWLKSEGVELHVEEDGRMFPTTNSSETIISCFLSSIRSLEIDIVKNSCITQIVQQGDQESRITLMQRTEEGEIPFPLSFDAVVMATGSNSSSLKLLEPLGVTVVPQVPSLFTFNIPSSPFSDLAGVSIENAAVSLPQLQEKKKIKQAEGPLLITHWGLSGPAILKLSAFFARDLFNHDYKTVVHIDWIPLISRTELEKKIYQIRASAAPGKLLKNIVVSEEIPKSIFEVLMKLSNIPLTQAWNNLSNSQTARLIQVLKQTALEIEGKTTYKNEFVTAGGVALSEVDPKSLSLKKYPWLFFTGEVLDIDGITGGFNFQAAWTTAWAAARGVATFVDTSSSGL